jgi:hypothetical protein
MSCIVCGQEYNALELEKIMFEVLTPAYRDSDKIQTVKHVRKMLGPDKRTYHYCRNCDYVLDEKHELSDYLICIMETVESKPSSEELTEKTNAYIDDLDGQIRVNDRINEELKEIADAEKCIPERINSIIGKLEISSEHGLSQHNKDYFTGFLKEVWNTELEKIPDIKSQICRLGGIENYVDGLLKVCCDDFACIIVPQQRRVATDPYLLSSKYAVRKLQLQQRIREELGLQEKPDPETVLMKQIEFMINNGVREDNVLREVGEEGLKIIGDQKIRTLFDSKIDPRYITAAAIYLAGVKKHKENRDKLYRLNQREMMILGPTSIATRNNCHRIMGLSDEMKKLKRFIAAPATYD